VVGEGVGDGFVVGGVAEGGGGPGAGEGGPVGAGGDGDGLAVESLLEGVDEEATFDGPSRSRSSMDPKVAGGTSAPAYTGGVKPPPAAKVVAVGRRKDGSHMRQVEALEPALRCRSHGCRSCRQADTNCTNSMYKNWRPTGAHLNLGSSGTTLRAWNAQSRNGHRELMAVLMMPELCQDRNSLSVVSARLRHKSKCARLAE
jgi:hypothetical protein